MSCANCKQYYGSLITADLIEVNEQTNKKLTFPLIFHSERCMEEFKAKLKRNQMLTNIRTRKARCIKLSKKCGNREPDGSCSALSRFELFECDPKFIPEPKKRKRWEQ